MTSVGIITILKVGNYGAELQAFALQRKLERLGYKAEIIDYLFYKNPKHVAERSSRPFYPYSFHFKVKEIGLRLRDALQKLCFPQLTENRNKRFDDFHAANTHLSRTFRRLSELQAAEFRYDVFCVGSDQVWNPRCNTNLAPYLLSFAPDDARKVSYASSFGVTSLPKSAEDVYRRLLGRFNCIGVREDSGASLVRSLTGREATVVLDPTLLLTADEWAEVERPLEGLPHGFVLVYELRRQDTIDELASNVSKELKVPIMRLRANIGTEKPQAGIIDISDAGPAEFLYLFRNASFVVTNSFHGTAFSVNFNKPFYSVLDRQRSNNSRQLNLLERCGLTSRVAYEGEETSKDMSLAIDFAKANSALEVMRKESINYLTTAIDG